MEEGIQLDFQIFLFACSALGGGGEIYFFA